MGDLVLQLCLDDQFTEHRHVEVQAHAQIRLRRRGVCDLANHRHLYRDDEELVRSVGEDVLADDDAFAALGDEYHGLFVHRVNRPGCAGDPDQIQAGNAGDVNTFTVGVSRNEVRKVHAQPRIMAAPREFCVDLGKKKSALVYRENQSLSHLVPTRRLTQLTLGNDQMRYAS